MQSLREEEINPDPQDKQCVGNCLNAQDQDAGFGKWTKGIGRYF